ncbi:MAG: hypothetical protein HC871_00145 [Rhizobiales bacterium]|nr:hypothetical protein [Hyphomicrobiales bacterium]
MTRINILQTNFASGELDPQLLGRSDLRSQENGAARLQNVFVETTGGVRRRSGMAYLATAAGRGRLATFEPGSGGIYLFVFSDLQLDIYEGETLLVTLATPWVDDDIKQLSWAQFGDSVLVTHPDHTPQRVLKVSDVSWTIADLEFSEKESGLSCQPFARFSADDVTLTSSGTSGTVTLTASDDVFVAEHLGAIFRFQGHQIQLTNIISATSADGLVLASATLASTGPTIDWDEQAFSDARGWPIALSFHQNRMVIGGSRDLPNGLWLSRSGRFLDFDLGTGLADEAIAFRLSANSAPAVRALQSGRHLQIFTSIGEWIVTGDPLTPENIQLGQQSRIGSPIDRQVPPRDVDGATLFASRSGQEIREFVFADTEQAYQAPDLALAARHLVRDPIDQAFDRQRRLFLIVMADGSMATIGIYRNADIVAWSRQSTDGTILSVAVTDTRTFLLVERANGVFVEVLTDDLFVDAGLQLSEAVPTTLWSGLDHLEGQTVTILTDAGIVESAVVSSGQITLAAAASAIAVGLPYTHVVEPLAPATTSTSGRTQEPLYRPIRLVLRVLETSSLRVDTGSGPRDLLFPVSSQPTPFTGDQTLRALGWRRGAKEPPWRIEQSTPLPFTLLSATTEIKVNS